MPIEWVTLAVVLAIHDEQIAEHGGSPSGRDSGLFESALARPQNVAAYGDGDPDIAHLAAAYAFGIARNHPFIDGNKRTSAVVSRLFLRLNGYDVTASEVERLQIWLRLAAGQIDEDSLVKWFQSNTKPSQAARRA